MKSIFNEKRYLKGNLEDIKYFEECRTQYRNNKEQSFEKNKDIFKYYDIYLEYIADLLIKLRLNSSIDYSVALGYLIKKGYLSDGLKFSLEESDKEINGKLGISIVQGSGCCRNICDIQSDIFNILNINIIPFYCYQGNDFFMGLNKKANHIINLVEYKNNMYGIDLYNDRLLYSFKNSYIMKSISSEHDSKIRYKPYYEIIIDGRTIDDIRERIKLFNEYSREKAISYFEYEMGIKYEIDNHLFEKKDELNEFHNKTKLLRKNIISRMNSE